MLPVDTTTRTEASLAPGRLAKLAILHALFPALFEHSAALHQIVADTLYVAARQINLLGVAPQRLHPIPNVSGCPRSVVTHSVAK